MKVYCRFLHRDCWDRLYLVSQELERKVMEAGGWGGGGILLVMELPVTFSQMGFIKLKCQQRSRSCSYHTSRD